MTKSRKLIVLTATALAIGAPADPVSAQVFVDPDSPTGKEYAIPLEDARRDAASGGSSDLPVPQGERSAPLFGEGIGDEEPTGTPSGGSEGETAGKSLGEQEKPEAEGSEEQSSGQASPSFSRPQPAAATVPQGGFSDAATIGALAVSVLLLGGVLGSIARRRTP